MKTPNRYYCTDKPPMPGTVPRGMIRLVDFKSIRHVEEIDTDAYGYVEYHRDLTERETLAFGLVRADNTRNCNDDQCDI